MSEVEDLIGCNLVRLIHEGDERNGTVDYGKVGKSGLGLRTCELYENKTALNS